MHLRDLSSTPDRFFDIMPKDWQQEIVPVWGNYKSSSTIWGLEKPEEVVAGCVIFRTVSPDVEGYKAIAQSWFDRGYCYLAFLYVKESERGKGVGSHLMKEIGEKNPKERYWLSIDNVALAKFYIALGFEVAEQVSNGDWQEWIMVKP